MIHIYYDTWSYTEDYVREYTSEGEPMWDGYEINVEQAFCGNEDYEGKIAFTMNPEEAECDECIEAFVMQTLADLP